MPDTKLSDNKNDTPEFVQIVDNVWVPPVLNDYKFSCCDCGLVHDMDFQIVTPNYLRFRVRRNELLTADIRNKMTFKRN